MITVKEIASEGASALFWGGVSFGMGCLSGKITQAPILTTGILFGVSSVASSALSYVQKAFAKKYNWNLSTVKVIAALTAAAMVVATSVAAFALGVFGPTGVLFYGGLGLLFPAISLGIGLYIKYGGKDLPYSDALKSEESFYQFVVN